jgi:UDP-glucose 4-epimerase
MRVMVTGGAGYIGSVITAELLSRGHEVLVYDNLSKGHRDAVPAEAVFIEGDLLDRTAVVEALRGHRAEAVVHMAAASLVGESVREPAWYYRQNVEAGVTLLDAMRETGATRLVFSSTAAVYGAPATIPIDEDTPTAPTNPYGETKLAVERALPWYAAAYGLRWISLRYFNAAGATERHGERHDPETHLIPLVLDAAAGRRPDVQIYGDDYPTPDGTCLRDYIHVSDLAVAHVLALEALGAGAGGRTYNLGCGGTGYSVRDVIASAEAVTGRRIPVRVAPRRPGDPPVLIASSTRAQRELGWRPVRQDLLVIIRSAWDWMRRAQAPEPAAAGK